MWILLVFRFGFSLAIFGFSDTSGSHWIRILKRAFKDSVGLGVSLDWIDWFSLEPGFFWFFRTLDRLVFAGLGMWFFGYWSGFF